MEHERCERCGTRLSAERIEDDDTICGRCDRIDAIRDANAVKAAVATSLDDFLGGPEARRATRIRNISEQEAALARENPDWRVHAMKNMAECGWCLRQLDARHVALKACPTNQGNPV